MKKFFKENWFKVIISLALIIIAGSVSYYFVIYLPAKEKSAINQQLLMVAQENTKNCAEAGQKYFDKNLNEYKNNEPQIILNGPYFHYNKSLQACLLEYKVTTYDSTSMLIDHNNYLMENYIVNLITGEMTQVTLLWKNGDFANSYYESEYERFRNLETDLMQN